MTGRVAVAAAAVAFLAALWWWDRRAARAFDRHVDAALALAAARDRHPATRGRRPSCACDDPGSLRAHTPTRCVPLCACRRRLPDPEPWHHGRHGCFPARELMS